MKSRILRFLIYIKSFHSSYPYILFSNLTDSGDQMQIHNLLPWINKMLKLI